MGPDRAALGRTCYTEGRRGFHRDSQRETRAFLFSLCLSAPPPCISVSQSRSLHREDLARTLEDKIRTPYRPSDKADTQTNVALSGETAEVKTAYTISSSSAEGSTTADIGASGTSPGKMSGTAAIPAKAKGKVKTKKTLSGSATIQLQLLPADQQQN